MHSEFSEPTTLPGGFWEVIQPLADWILTHIKIAYRHGYLAGQTYARTHPIS